MKTADLELCYMSATDVLKNFRTKKISPSELTKALISRCKDVNPSLNAITENHFQEATEAAKKQIRNILI